MAGEVAQNNNDALSAILQQLFVGTGKETTKTTSDPANTNALQQLMAVLTGTAGGAKGDFSKQAAITDSTGQVAKLVNDSLQNALPDISSLNTKSGLYNSTTTKQLVDDLLARTSLQGQQATQENIKNYAAIQQGNSQVASQAVNAGTNAVQVGNRQVTKQTAPIANPLLSLGLGLGKSLLNKSGVTDKIGKAIKDIFNPATSISASDSAGAVSAIGNSTANLGNFQTPSFGANSPFSSVNFTGVPLDIGSSGNNVGSLLSSLDSSSFSDILKSSPSVDVAGAAGSAAGGIDANSLLGSGGDSVGGSLVQSLLGSSNSVAGAFSGASPSIFGTAVGNGVSSSALSGIQSIVGGGIGDLFGAASGGLAGSLAANVGGNGLFGGIDFLGSAGSNLGGLANGFNSSLSSALPFAGSVLDAFQGNFGGGLGGAIGTLFGPPVIGPLLGNFIGSNIGSIGDAVGSVVGAVGDALSSVICTELARQGFITKELLAKDTAYARSNLSLTTMAGYHAWAIPVVRLMRKSSLLTRLIAPFGIKFCNHVAGNRNIVGALVLNIGTPICFAIGKCVETLDKTGAYNHG